MTATRENPFGYPKRFYAYHGKRRITYFLVDKNNRRINLGHNYDDAIAKYAIAICDDKHDKRTAEEIWKSCRKNASSRKIDFSLTIEEINFLLTRSNRKCEITGIQFSDHKLEGMRIRPWLASIDRLDNSIGYTLDNCRIVCASVNLAMNQFGEKFFHELVNKIVKSKKIIA